MARDGRREYLPVGISGCCIGKDFLENRRMYRDPSPLSDPARSADIFVRAGD
uniref:Uncharacterized protein n=1 Tax=Candidatus Kentrum sp. SD TaxID=2126332 RepID=A0A451BQP9_9GAMM|nr:MAG: hypothetical protein BECKSD772F_GA0070984_11234 [Candidatus Kentron sp. SD]VFK48586.1 MAG: hypothetical protein BECKSD772E_GA0070983_11315 [Candidatus Kentron sp. SD]VFK80598.1 MAG: hypothetical protein BECKSD772D_GA0070982_11324 [Candidatus Kentron sp. SD]